jgi:hypothetical protein
VQDKLSVPTGGPGPWIELRIAMLFLFVLDQMMVRAVLGGQVDDS